MSCKYPNTPEPLKERELLGRYFPEQKGQQNSSENLALSELAESEPSQNTNLFWGFLFLGPRWKQFILPPSAHSIPCPFPVPALNLCCNNSLDQGHSTSKPTQGLVPTQLCMHTTSVPAQTGLGWAQSRNQGWGGMALTPPHEFPGWNRLCDPALPELQPHQDCFPRWLQNYNYYYYYCYSYCVQAAKYVRDFVWVKELFLVHSLRISFSPLLPWVEGWLCLTPSTVPIMHHLEGIFSILSQQENYSLCLLTSASPSQLSANSDVEHCYQWKGNYK